MMAGSAKFVEMRGPSTEPKADEDDAESLEGIGSGNGFGAGSRDIREPRWGMADEASRYVGMATMANERNFLGSESETERELSEGE